MMPMAIPGISVVQFFAVCCGWKIHPTAKVSEEVNRKCPHTHRNTTVQLSTAYTDPQRHNTLNSQTDGQTDKTTLSRQ